MKVIKKRCRRKKNLLKRNCLILRKNYLNMRELMQLKKILNKFKKINKIQLMKEEIKKKQMYLKFYCLDYHKD